jgi:predicted nucleic-acid-binding protein
VKVAVDTNNLVRAAVGDDPDHSPKAVRFMCDAELVLVSTAALCEFVWVVHRGYRLDRADVVKSLRELVDSPNVSLDTAAVLAGIEVFEAGGDFADGAIAAEGMRMGAEAFATFDKRAARLVEERHYKTMLLG